MPRKRPDPSILEVAFSSRWPVSAALCGLSVLVGLVILPALFTSNAAFRPLAATIRMLALIPVAGFGVIALVKFLRESGTSSGSTSDRVQRKVVDRTSDIRLPNEGASDGPGGLARRDPVMTPNATEWSLALLQSIEWKRFEDVVAAYFRAKNFRCQTIEYGPDGGVDGRLYFGDLSDPVGIVQCKAWGNKQVGVAPVRELLGVMSHEKVGRGYFCATGDFSKEASAFAAANPIKLISGRDLLEAIAQMPEEARQRLLELSTAGDYTTPTCPSCGIKLVPRTIGGRAAWGCTNYPRCKTKIFRKRDPNAASVAA